MSAHKPGSDSSPVPGNTPLDDEEREGLIPSHILSRSELNQWEAVNIGHARDWLAGRRSRDVLSVEFLCELHRRMFDETWKWAGTLRQSEKTISPHGWSDVPHLLDDLVENTRVQYDLSGKAPEAADEAADEIAMRFHHGLVRIHPWPNGNGRHGRVATDLLLEQWGRQPFSWGGAGNLLATGTARARYIAALETADGGEFAPLRSFVRS